MSATKRRMNSMSTHTAREGGQVMSALRFLNSQDEFDRAIAGGRLSADQTSPLYAGHYMYMGTRDNGESLFKHTITRQYLSKAGR